MDPELNNGAKANPSLTNASLKDGAAIIERGVKPCWNAPPATCAI